MKDDNFDISIKLIAAKLLRLDDELAKIRGVHLFISSLTGITSNAIESSAKKAGKRKRKGQIEDIFQQQSQSIENDNSNVLFDHGVAYFIAYTPSNSCNQYTIFELFHKNEMEATVHKIRTRSIKVDDDENESMREQLLKELELVVKDHKCPAIVKMLKESNKFCFHRSLAETDYDENELFLTKLPEYGKNDLSDKPCHIFVLNTGQFLSKLQSVCNELNNDGLQIYLKGNLEGSNDDPVSVSFEPTSCVLSGNEKLANSMKALGHVLYKGDLYRIPPGPRYTSVYMMDVDTYLHKMMANDNLREDLVKHGDRIANLRKHPACELIKQIEFDFDLIDVMLPCGTCLRISKRKLVLEPFSDDDVRKVSPRMYVPYDSSTPPNPKYFRESILNSFPEDYNRANFLNKSYQCLMAGRMPHKVRKLMVKCPKDSGKTTWASVFLGIIPMKFVASITQEAQFSPSMMNEDAQLVFLDEWSDRTFASDMAKVVLQGGFMVQVIKHGKPRSMENRIHFTKQLTSGPILETMM